MIGTRPMDLPPPKDNAQPGFHPDIPARFNSLEEARNNLDYQWHLFHQKAVDKHVKMISGIETEEDRAAHDRDRYHFKLEYQRWSTAFQKFLDMNVASMESKALQGAMVLKLTAHVISMHLEISNYEIRHDQNCWDALFPVCKELVDIAAVVIEADKVTDGRSNAKPVFQMDHDIIGPLFSVAHRCRDPHLRRRAISLLYKVPRQEGIWNSFLTARVAERLVSIEEEGLEVKGAADIPGWKRISDVEVSLDQQRKRGSVRYSRLRSHDSTARELVTDVLEW
ncbi:MAG: hypothetical protein Q9216_006212 [Gyalolechia sp. 2 TL-2023]